MRMTKRLLPYLILILFPVIIYSCSDGLTGSDGDRNRPQPFNHKVNPGDSAKAFLEGDQYSTLNLEIDYMEGYEPTQRALDSLETFLQKHLNKENINIGVPNSIPAAGQNAYTANEIRNLEEQHRDHFTGAGSDTLWAYFLFVDGEFNEANVLGIAYWSSSMAFFGQTIADNSGGIGQDNQYELEGTVFRHEFGHIMGLVNAGTPMVEPHQDGANGHHCTEENCVMYYQTNTTDFFANTMDGNLPDLLQYCQADVQANGGK